MYSKHTNVSKPTLSILKLNIPLSYLTESMTLKSFQISSSNIHPSPSSPDTFPVIVHLSFVHAHMHTMPMHKINLQSHIVLMTSSRFFREIGSFCSFTVTDSLSYDVMNEALARYDR